MAVCKKFFPQSHYYMPNVTIKMESHIWILGCSNTHTSVLDFYVPRYKLLNKSSETVIF